MSNLLKNLLITLGIAITLFVGYVLVRDMDNGSYSMNTTAEEVELETQQLLTTLSELKSFDVSGDLFADPLFLSLKDFRHDLGEEPSGRMNPFAPVQ